MSVMLDSWNGIKTHDSESRGQEEAGRTRQTSELFTHSTALKFVNALNKHLNVFEKGCYTAG